MGLDAAPGSTPHATTTAATPPLHTHEDTMTQTDLFRFTTFGALLHYLRRRARLTQRELAIAVGYSEAHISRLERDQRLPDLTTLAALFIPTLELEDDPEAAARLMELAAAARGETLAGRTLTMSHTVSEETSEEIGSIQAPPGLPALYVQRAELRELRQQLKQTRALQVCGMPGVGKTTLAAALAAAWPSDQPVFWLTLTPGVTTDVDAVVRQLALFVLGQGEQSVLPLVQQRNEGTLPPLDQQLNVLCAALNSIPCLLCFDQAQSISANAEVLALLQHLIAATRTPLIIISRERLTLQQTGTFTLHGMRAVDAAQLFDLLNLNLPQPIQAQVIARTQGNPMLLRLIGGQIQQVQPPLEQWLDRLAQQPQVAAYLIETTLSTIPPELRPALNLLAVADMPLNLYDEALVELAQAVLGPLPWDLLIEELTRRQLIDQPAQAQLPLLLRDHIYSTLVARLDDRRALHKLIAEWYEHIGDDPLIIARHYARAQQHQTATALLEHNLEQLINRGQSNATTALVDDLLLHARRHDVALRPTLLTLRGDLLVHTLRGDEAEANYREALGLVHTPQLRASVTWRLVNSLLQRGLVHEAHELCSQVLAELRPEDRLLRGELLAAQSKALLMLSQFDAALAAADATLQIAKTLVGSLAFVGDRFRAAAGGTRAIILQIKRQPDQALQQWREVISAAERAGLQRSLGRALANIGNIYNEYGQLDLALQTYNRALLCLRAVGDSYALARLLHGKAMLHQYRMEWDAALADNAESCAIKRQIGDVQGRANSLNQRATILINLGQLHAAHELIQQVLVETQSTGEQWAQHTYLDTLALTELLLGQHTQAQQRLEQLLKQPIVVQDQRLHTFVVNHLALAHAVQGHSEQARALLEQLDAGDGEVSLEHRVIQLGISALTADARTLDAQAQAISADAQQAGFPLWASAATRIAAQPRPLAPATLPALIFAHAAADDMPPLANPTNPHAQSVGWRYTMVER